MGAPQMIVNTINILETIYGNSESKTIELSQSHIFRGYEPSLQPGGQLVLFLHKQETTDGYVAVYPYASYYYIDTQQAIHPVYHIDDFTTYSNMQLKDFKKAINKID